MLQNHKLETMQWVWGWGGLERDSLAYYTVPLGVRVHDPQFFFCWMYGSPTEQYACRFFVSQPYTSKTVGFPQQLLLVIQIEKKCNSSE